MRQLPVWLWAASAAAAFLIFSAGALLYGNDWWLSAIMTVLLLVWFAGVLAAIYAPPGRRATILGAVVCSFLYILLALGPWFSNSVSPWLLTTRVLSTIETHWLSRKPVQQMVYQVIPSPYISGGSYPYGGMGYSGGSPVWTTSFLPANSWTGPTNTLVPVSSGPSIFVSIGHWLCGVLAAATGALAAAWISRRKSPPAREGVNPFAANAPPAQFMPLTVAPAESAP